jgi:putative copper resistance protein D
MTLRSRHTRLGPALALAVTALAAAPGTVLGHGDVPAEAPTVASLILGWTLDPAVTAALLAAAVLWIWAVRRVDAAHRAHPVPRARSVAFFGGLAAIAVALLSGIERYEGSLFSVHMVQHLLLALVAAPLLALAAPVTVLLRVARPDLRRRFILPALHSQAVRIVTHPVVAWIALAGVMWGTHFSPLFDAALEDRALHDLEHLLFLGAGLLFWWPAVAADPAPRRLGHPVRILYVFMQMPQNTFLAVTLLNAGQPLYPHYATLERAWGPGPLEDQQIAAGIMWLGGDLLFLAAVFVLIASWMRAEERSTAAADRRSDASRVAIDERAARHAASRGRAEGASPMPRGVNVEPGSEPAAAPDSVPDPRSRR